MIRSLFKVSHCLSLMTAGDEQWVRLQPTERLISWKYWKGDGLGTSRQTVGCWLTGKRKSMAVTKKIKSVHFIR